MTCPKCKSPNKPSASYCLQCGFRLSGGTAVPVTPDPPARSDGRKRTLVMTPAVSTPSPDAPARKNRKTQVVTPAAKKTPVQPKRKPAAKTTFYGPGQNPLANSGTTPSGPNAEASANDRRKLRGFLATFDFDALGQSFTLTEGRNVLGRDAAECGIVLDKDPTVSRRHAVIMARPNQVYVRDQDSEYGTQVNGQEIGMDGRQLADGDTLTICGYSLTIKLL